MNNSRFSNRFPIAKQDADLSGFTTNPLADRLTPAQMLMYQAAFEQAQKVAAEPEAEWPWAECWNPECN